VTNTLSNTVTILNTNSGSPILCETLNVGNEPFSAAVGPMGGWVYVTNDEDNTITIINNMKTTPNIAGTYGLANLSAPDAVAVNPSTKDPEVAEFASSMVITLPAE
jgi:DNA-binding beta-propeller fold protein YncE